MKLDLPRGMRDVAPDEFYEINQVKEKFFETSGLFNFNLMEPSPLELLSTLEAKSGSSIVREIYSFKDKGERNIALRFDLTVGLTRYVASRRDLKLPAKIASFAGVWRYDEPQAGRYRYFHQWDIELYGSTSIESDAEIVEFVSVFMKKLGLDIIIAVNDRKIIEEFLVEKLGISDPEMLSETFRALDKVPKKGADSVIAEYKDKIPSSKLHALMEFAQVKGDISEVSQTGVQNLKSWSRFARIVELLYSKGIKNIEINFGIVRGLDYYSGLVFEAYDPTLNIGSLVGGGRYDNLTGAFGRSDMGATGAAGGVERILLAMKKHNLLKQKSGHPVYIIFQHEKVKDDAMRLVSELRNNGVSAEYDINCRSSRKQIDDAINKRAEKIILIKDPIKTDDDLLTLKIVKDGSETRYRVGDIVSILQKG